MCVIFKINKRFNSVDNSFLRLNLHIILIFVYIYLEDKKYKDSFYIINANNYKRYF